MADRQAVPARPAWKEPMLWLVVAIPAASVIASVALLVSAARSSGNNDAVTDRVQRTAQIQVADLAPDLAARRLQLAATLRVQGDRIRVSPASAAFPRDAMLRLTLQHPLRAQHDITLDMPRDGEDWQLQHPLARGHDWNLTLAPADSHWRLQGRLLRGRDTAELRPALASR